jgi:hypothetical protein
VGVCVVVGETNVVVVEGSIVVDVVVSVGVGNEEVVVDSCVVVGDGSVVVGMVGC